MTKNYSIQSVVEICKTQKFVNAIWIVLFAIVFTLVLSSKYFLFQNILTDTNTSKRDLYTQKTITVVDTYKTELQKKAAEQKVDPVLMLAENSYITNDFHLLLSSIASIRSQKLSYEAKREALSELFDMVNHSDRIFVVNYLMYASNKSVNSIFSKATDDLNNVLLKINISAKNFDTATMNSTIYKYLGASSKHRSDEAKVMSVLIEQVIIPNIIINEQATKLAKENAVAAVAPYTKTYQKGDKILYEGQQVNKFERAVLKEAGYSVLDINIEGFLGIFAIVLISVIAFLYYLHYFEKPYLTKNYLTIIGLLAIIIAAIAALRPDDFSVYIIPIQIFILLIAILMTPRISFIATFILMSIISLSFMFTIQPVIIYSLIALYTTISIAKIKYAKRVDLVKVGIGSAIIMTLLILSIYAIESCAITLEWGVLLKDVISAFSVSFVSGILTLGLLPLMESMFKIITPYELAELGDQNQPLLKRLQIEAPGTFSHSTMVANLAENAAEAVGADPVLARVGALYHDIGKLKRPLFFIENQPFFGIENPHSKINPRLSKMVVTAHPKDGVELAKDNGLPVIIQDLILQHHGESLATYFYAEAIKQDGEGNVSEDLFRYSGPKPTTKEAAILMIADAVEAAARTLNENYTQEELEKLINKIIKERLDDEQLSDSPLTLKDLKTIAVTFNRILRAAHHQRIKYHEDIILELKNRATEKNDKVNKKNDEN